MVGNISYPTFAPMKTKIQLEAIKSAIEEKGLKKKWIAKKVNVSEPTICLFLKGQRTISEDKYNSLTKLLGV